MGGVNDRRKQRFSARRTDGHAGRGRRRRRAARADRRARSGARGRRPRRRFKAWISRGDGPGRTTLQEATLRPIGGRQVVVRTEATNLCYSNVPAVLGLQPPARRAAERRSRRRPALAGSNDMAVIQGHGGIGIVEAVGPEVRRVQVGDRVCVSGTPHCGVCYRCLRGRSDMCQFLSAIGADDLVAIADLEDGTPVYRELAHRRPGRADGHVRGVGRADLHEAARGRRRHGVQLRRGRGSRRDHRARADARSSPRRASRSSAAGRSA